MAIMKATYDSGKNEVLYVKIGGRLQELSLDTPFGPSGPNVVSMPQIPKKLYILRFHIFIESNL